MPIDDIDPSDKKLMNQAKAKAAAEAADKAAASANALANKALGKTTSGLKEGVQYVGSTLQYVDPSGNILPASSAPKAPASSSTPATGASIAEDQRLNELKKAGATKGTTTAGGGEVDPVTQAYIDAMNRSTAASNAAANATAAAAQAERVSAFNILKDEFTKYGLGSLVDGIKKLLTDGTPASEFSLKLRETPEYVARFKANEARIAAGLTALSPAEYVAMEDQYQNIMRNYGLPSSYYTKDTTGKQAGFEKFLANDVSASELEDRIATAQQRVLNSNPETLQALKQFYPDISNADILAYALDPQNALSNIKRKVTAAEIGGAALAQGLQAQGGTAESLAGLGITKAQAQQGYTDIAGILPRGSQLADIYGETPYTQQTAEAEVFNTAGAAEAARKRKKLTALEQAQFGGSSGVGALGRDKGIYGGTSGQSGQY